MIEFTLTLTLIVVVAFWVVYAVFYKDKKKPPKTITNNHRDAHSDYRNDEASPKIESYPFVSENLMDDDLATFTISYGYEEVKSKNKTLGRWVDPSETIIVKDFTITNGNFFYGGKLNGLDDCSTESSLVDNSLKIKKEPIEYEDDTLGYWPKFISLSPNARGAYLNWLASSRDNPSTPLGYVFIYFYGLERRILIDAPKGGVDNDEFLVLFDEITRLQDIYGQSRSFLNYSTRLLELMCLIRPELVSIQGDNYIPSNDSLLFKHQLATAVNAGISISKDLALSWIKFYPEYNFRTPARRCDKEFSSLFKLRYTQKFGNGFIVKPNKTRLKFQYSPASSSLRGVDIGSQDLPDPSVLKTPVKKLLCTRQKECLRVDKNL